MTEPNTRTEPDFGTYITGITLGGFQVFDEPTDIPLGQLTFLFGPNSAGKSAVEDALVLLSGLLSQTSGKGANFEPPLERHWRRTDGSDSGFAPLLTLGITASIPTNLPCVLGLCDEAKDYPLQRPAVWGHEVRAAFVYRFNDEYGQGWDSIYSDSQFRMAVDGEELLAVEMGERMGIRIKHPLVRGAKFAAAFEVLATELPQYVEAGDGWVWLRSRYCRLDRGDTDRELLVALAGSGDEAYVKPDDWDRIVSRLRPAVDAFVDAFDQAKGVAWGNASITPETVPASRTIPTREELTCLCDLSGWDSGLGEFVQERDSKRKYQDLAEACWMERTGSDKHTLGAGKGLIADVNRALSDHLFMERGYRIGADFRVLLGLEQFTDISFATEGDAADYPAMVRMFLADSEGRRYGFEEVGSGLGYVLPVLCSVYHPRVSVSLLQQPELHLHPALQTALGDVFIEAASPEHQLIVETHSEHVLLRVLKRIRQTNGPKPPAPELRISPQDVVVVYFDPRPDGTTTVKRLRISEDGEFLDRWPRGFFCERDAELFDE